MNHVEVTYNVFRAVAKQVGVETATIVRNAHLVNDLGMDSLDAIELSFDLEDEFNIPIEDEDATAMQTVGNIVDLISSKLEEKERGKAQHEEVPWNR
jgi:acyl carrier protein